jgi:cholesterol oxidase
MERRHFDAVVVGSGFGGSVVTARLAEAGLRVCLLERGRRYPPGSFARSPREMRANFWDPSEGLYGLFDLWSFRGTEALVASGLGGGSLIYANVLIRKDERWFVKHQPLPGGGEEHWPIDRADLDPFYDRVEDALGATSYPFDHPPYDATPKTRGHRDAARRAGYAWHRPPLAVSFAPRPGAPPVPGAPIEEAHPNLHGRARSTCRLCGECDVGCQYGSKNTLDYTYLSAATRKGAEIRDLCEVRSVGRRDGGGFFVRYVRHRPDLDPEDPRTEHRLAVEITADRLVLSAGALGSPYLLLRNRHRLGALSPRLGHRFCGNGDLLGFLSGARERTPRGSRVRPLAPDFGPVITSTIRLPDEVDGGPGRGAYVQEGGYPVFGAWAWEAGRNLPGFVGRGVRFALRRIRARLTGDPRSELDGEVARLLGDAERSWSGLPLLGMGRDTPDGVMGLRDRYLDVRWTMQTSEAYFSRVRDAMRDLAEALDADFSRNPIGLLRRVVTVHPLGGCPMAEDPAAGVVDDRGRVFGQEGLYVADGSVMPGPVGPNPALTIAAFAERVAEGIVDSWRPTP